MEETKSILDLLTAAGDKEVLAGLASGGLLNVVTFASKAITSKLKGEKIDYSGLKAIRTFGMGFGVGFLNHISGAGMGLNLVDMTLLAGPVAVLDQAWKGGQSLISNISFKTNTPA